MMRPRPTPQCFESWPTVMADLSACDFRIAFPDCWRSVGAARQLSRPELGGEQNRLAVLHRHRKTSQFPLMGIATSRKPLIYNMLPS